MQAESLRRVCHGGVSGGLPVPEPERERERERVQVQVAHAQVQERGAGSTVRQPLQV